MKWGKLQVMIVLLGLAAGLAAAGSGGYKFYNLKNVSGATYTFALGLNSEGTIVGWYLSHSGLSHGYVQRGGRMHTIKPPHSFSSYASGINDSGVVVGGFCGARISCGLLQAQRGFIQEHGAFQTLSDPLAGAGSTIAIGVNNTGQIVGGYCTFPLDACPIGGLQPSDHGFLYDNGVFTTLDYPGSPLTEATAINDSGLIVGTFDEGFGTQAFLYENGAYTNIGFPGAVTTAATGINNAAVVVGYFVDQQSIEHGFRYDHATGIFTQVDVPGVLSLALNGISNRGDVVASGYFTKRPFPSSAIGLLPDATTPDGVPIAPSVEQERPNFNN